MHLKIRVSHLARRTVAIFATLLSALLVAAFGAAMAPGVAAAAPGENIPNEEVLYSATEDGPFGTAKDNIVWDKTTIIPGGENKTVFYVKNGSEVPVDLQIFAGNWSISKGFATFSAEIDGKREDSGVRTGSATPETAGIALGSAPLAPGATAKVALIVGMPLETGNESQGSTISPRWAIIMEETAGEDSGGENEGNGTGSLGSFNSQSYFGSLAAAGSLTSLGSLGDFGSLGFAGIIGGPVVHTK